MADVERWLSLDLATDPHEARFEGDPHQLVDAAGCMAAMADRPAWQADAACREHPEVSWFTARGQDARPAKRVCAGCLVRSECLAFALDQGPTLRGVWGGMSERERRQLRRTAARDPSCGSPGLA